MLSFFISAAIVYIVFNIFWGINYDRQSIAERLHLKIEKYTAEDLRKINDLLIRKINATKSKLLLNNKPYPTRSQMFAMTANAYRNISEKYPILGYYPSSLKSSMWGWVGNYTVFLGYYNPFTGEAQVNTTVPAFTQPFTTCHEVAHQLGYAKEMEANFVGYLAAAASSDSLFQYSAYTELFTYANRTLYFADSSSALQYRKLLLPEVKADFAERKKFNAAHTSFLQPIVSVIYGKFLQANRQPMGILSYDEVTGFIISYYKKFGKI